MRSIEPRFRAGRFAVIPALSIFLAAFPLALSPAPGRESPPGADDRGHADMFGRPLPEKEFRSREEYLELFREAGLEIESVDDATLRNLTIFRLSPKASRDLEEIDPCVKIELERIERLYGLLDRFAGQVWPGWDNYMDIEFQAIFPNRVQMIVNPRGMISEDYKVVEGTTVRGKQIFLNRKNEIPLSMKPPLGRGGNARFGRVIINLEVMDKAPAPGAFHRDNAVALRDFQSDVQLLTYVHEMFHEYQSKAWPVRAAQMKTFEKTWEKQAQLKSVPAKPRLKPKSEMPLIFYVPLHYAVYKEIEGRALLSAYGEQDDRGAVEYLKDAFVAGEMRRKGMEETDVAREMRLAAGEGTAQYAQVKMARLIRDAGYRPPHESGADPYFFNFRFMDEVVRYETGPVIEDWMRKTQDSRGFQYLFGMLQGFLLDRFAPDWKNGFFENNRTFDDLIAGFLRLDESEKEKIAARLKTKYPYEEISARHAQTITARDDALSLIESRKGKTFIVDWTATNVLFPEIVPRGTWWQVDHRNIYPHGVEKIAFGEVELVGRDMPMEKTWIYYFEWVDTAAKERSKGYTLTSRSQEGSIYKDAVLTTAGFVLKAPEIAINEKEDEVWIQIRSQVGGDERTASTPKPAPESPKAEGQEARIANSAKIEEAVRLGTIAYRLTEPGEIEALLGRPSNVREGKDGGYDLLFWEYPDLAVRFAKMRRAGAPFVLRDVSVKGKPIDIGQSRKLALRTADDLGKIDSFWGLAGVSLTKLDLRQYKKFLDTMSFDTLTEWPPADRLPEGFEPGRLLSSSATPGFGVRALHEMGIDGTGIGLAIVDQPLLLGHREYSRRLIHYDAAGLSGIAPQMHASPVASIAVGQTLGVAPAAALAFFAVPTWEKDNEPYIRSLRAILALNGTLPSKERIRVVSISTGMFPQQPHFEEWKKALEKTEENGILVVTCDRGVFPYGILQLRPGTDPDNPASYDRGRNTLDDDLIRVPGQNRTVASHLGDDVYTFDRGGGMSWGAPYLAGLAALAFQVDPALRPSDIRKALVETAKKTDAGPIVDPAGFIALVRSRKTKNQPASEARSGP